MRISKRVESYIHDEVSKIAEVKREAIRAKYDDSMNDLRRFAKVSKRSVKSLISSCENR